MTDQPSDPATCQHPEVAAQVNVHRIQLQNGSIGAITMTVSARCSACGTDFWFPGLPSGVSLKEPVTSIDGFLVTLPMVAEGKRLDVDPTIDASTIVRNNDMFKGRKRP